MRWVLSVGVHLSCNHCGFTLTLLLSSRSFFSATILDYLARQLTRAGQHTPRLRLQGESREKSHTPGRLTTVSSAVSFDAPSKQAKESSQNENKRTKRKQQFDAKTPANTSKRVYGHRNCPGRAYLDCPPAPTRSCPRLQLWLTLPTPLPPPPPHCHLQHRPHHCPTASRHH